MRNLLFLLSFLIGLDLYAQTQLCTLILASANGKDPVVLGKGVSWDQPEALSLIDTLSEGIVDTKDPFLTSISAHKKHTNLRAWTFEGEAPIQNLADFLIADLEETKANLEKAKRGMKIAGVTTLAAELLTIGCHLMFGTPGSNGAFVSGYLLEGFIGGAVTAFYGLDYDSLKNKANLSSAFLEKLNKKEPGTLAHLPLVVPIPDEFSGLGELPPIRNNHRYTNTRYLQLDIVVRRNGERAPELHLIASTYVVSVKEVDHFR